MNGNDPSSHSHPFPSIPIRRLAPGDWIGWRENLHETIVFPLKDWGSPRFSSKFSLKPIQWGEYIHTYFHIYFQSHHPSDTCQAVRKHFYEVFPLAKTAYRRANGGSSAPGVHEAWWVEVTSLVIHWIFQAPYRAGYHFQGINWYAISISRSSMIFIYTWYHDYMHMYIYIYTYHGSSLWTLKLHGVRNQALLTRTHINEFVEFHLSLKEDVEPKFLSDTEANSSGPSPADREDMKLESRRTAAGLMIHFDDDRMSVRKWHSVSVSK